MRITKQDIENVSRFGQSLRRDTSAGPQRLAGLFCRGYITTLASPAGTGKTWLMQALACTLSRGVQLLPDEIDLFPPDKPIKTLIFEGEAETTLLNQRLAATAWEWDDNYLKVYNALDFATHNVPYFINTEEGRHTVVSVMEGERPDLVFFDSLIAWHTAKESAQEEMVTIFNFLMKLAKHYKCAIVLNHHTRKMPATHVKRALEADDVVGTGLFSRLSRDMYVLMQREDEVRVNHVKSWDKKLRVFSYRYVCDEWGRLDLLKKCMI